MSAPNLFVAYQFSLKGGAGYGYGSCEVIHDAPVRNWAALEAVRAVVTEKVRSDRPQLDNVVILNFRRFDAA